MHRLHLTARERASILDRQGGVCCAQGCGAREGLIAEYSTPNVLRPGKPDQLMCVACHKIKTRRDVKAIAKAKRLAGETMSQYQRRKAFGATIASRGFAERRR